MQYLWCCVDAFAGKGETMLGQDLIVAATQSRPPALIEDGSHCVGLEQGFTISGKPDWGK
jgi:hypothetical protein